MRCKYVSFTAEHWAVMCLLAEYLLNHYMGFKETQMYI